MYKVQTEQGVQTGQTTFTNRVFIRNATCIQKHESSICLTKAEFVQYVQLYQFNHYVLCTGVWVLEKIQPNR